MIHDYKSIDHCTTVLDTQVRGSFCSKPSLGGRAKASWCKVMTRAHNGRGKSLQVLYYTVKLCTPPTTYTTSYLKKHHKILETQVYFMLGKNYNVVHQIVVNLQQQVDT